MTDMKPVVVTTVPVCSACKGQRKVPVSRKSSMFSIPVEPEAWVICACVLESIESNEARISGLERLFLAHDGMDMSLLGEPKPMGDREFDKAMADFRPLDRPFIPFLVCAQCKSMTATKPMVVIDAGATLPRGSELPPEYDVCSEACAKAWHMARTIERRPGAMMTGTLVTVFKDDSGTGVGTGWLVRVLCSDGLVRVYDIDNETFGRALGYMHQKITVHVRPSREASWDVMPASLATTSGPVCAETLSVEDITIGSLLTDKTTGYPWFAVGSRVTKIRNRGSHPVPYVEMDLDPVCPGGSTIVDDNDVRSGRIVIDNTQVGTKVPR